MTDWSAAGEEPRGKRAKRWVRDPAGGLWLRKQPLTAPARPYEPVVETTALRMARAVGLEAPESSACEWDDEDGRKRGIVVRYFLDYVKEALAQGNELLGALEPGYDPENHALHELGRVRSVLETLQRANPPTELVPPFVDLLLFDAFLGNSDRHQENWGIVINLDGTARLAPVYDPASCLGVELKDDHRLLDPRRRTAEAVDKYVRACPSGFGDGTRLITQTDVVAIARSWPEWAGRAAGLFARLDRLRDTEIVPYLTSIPEDWLPQFRRDFMILLLEARARWLKERL